eukprot:CAMPEP_0198113110 /NCGR_PEP_ID=MMETSP1442-20131203/4867_1 /TAXON_ID= /ORGANISM="Craspedostauros australis, Strain CCMP3328" /LENGTH=94 /DNA_ID=CAMNT_0043770119 /DNA_START=69 /DNA_END=353 /DNA_ORIENTATION=-
MIVFENSGQVHREGCVDGVCNHGNADVYEHEHENRNEHGHEEFEGDISSEGLSSSKIPPHLRPRAHPCANKGTSSLSLSLCSLRIPKFRVASAK